MYNVQCRFEYALKYSAYNLIHFTEVIYFHKKEINKL